MKVTDDPIPVEVGTEVRYIGDSGSVPLGARGVVRRITEKGSGAHVEFADRSLEVTLSELVPFGGIARDWQVLVPFDVMPSLEDSDTSVWPHDAQVEVANATMALRKRLREWGVELDDPEMERFAKALAVAALEARHGEKPRT